MEKLKNFYENIKTLLNKGDLLNKGNIPLIVSALILPLVFFVFEFVSHELISLFYIILVISITKERKYALLSFIYILYLSIIAYNIFFHDYQWFKLLGSIGINLFTALYLGSLFEKMNQKRSDLIYHRRFERLITNLSTFFVNLSIRELDNGIEYVLESIGKFIDVDRVYVFKFKNNLQIMDNTHEWCREGVEHQKENLRDLPSSIFPWWMKKLYNFEEIVISDVSKMADEASTEKKILQEQDIQSVVVVPIISGDQLLGFMGFDSVQTKKDWSNTIIDLLKVVGQMLGNAIDRMRKEQEIRETSRKLEQITNNMTDMVCQINTNLEYQYVSPSYKITLGYESEELLGKSILNQVHPDDISKIREAAEEFPVELIEETLEFRMLHKEGHYIWIESVGKLITGKEGSKIIGAEFNLRDITARKKLEKKLKQKNEEQQILLDNIETQVWFLKDKRRYGAVNNAHAGFLGYGQEYLKDSDIYKFLDNSEVEICRAGNEMAFDQGKKIKTEEWVKNSEGDLRLLSITKTPKLDKTGQVEFVVCSALDITEQRIARNELKYRMKLEELMMKMATNFINISSDEIDNAIVKALNNISLFANVDHSYILLLSNSRDKFKIEYEWFNDKVNEKKHLKKEILITEIPYFIKKLYSDKIIKLYDIKQIPGEGKLEKNLLLSEGVASLLLLPLISDKKLIGILGFTIYDENKVWSDELVKLFKILSEIFINALEKKKYDNLLADYTSKLNESYLEIETANEKVNKNLAEAKKIHTQLLPGKFPDIDGLKFSADYTPAENVGGDFYNVIHIKDKVIFYLVDITGHGLDSAMLSIFVRETINSYLLSLSHQGKKLRSSRDIIEFLYDQYCQEGFPEEYFICIALGIIDISNMEINFCNTGIHIPPFMIRSNGKIGRLTNIRFPITSTITKDIFEFEKIREDVFYLEEGDILFMTTDGLIEETVLDSKYGEERLEYNLKSNLPPDLIINKIKKDFTKFTGTEEGKDDITMLAIHRCENILCQYHTEIWSCFEEIYKLKQIIFEKVKAYIDDFDHLWIGIVEMLINAVEHGNQMDQDKKISFDIEVSRHYIMFSIKDEGKGFDWKKKVNKNNANIAFKVSERGRGILMAYRVFDHLWYNKDGNLVNLLKEIEV